MKEPLELEPMRKIDEIRRFSNKELRLNKESMGAMPKSSEYCGPIRRKSYSYVSRIIGIAYNPFLNEDIRDCFFDYEQAMLLRFWKSRIATIRSAANQQAKLGLGVSSNVQEQIPSAFRSCGCKMYENDRGSDLLSAKVCKTSENVGKFL